MLKKWVLLPQESNDLLEQLFLNRKIKKEDWSSFLNPDFGKLFDPFLMKGMRKAVARIETALKNKEIIGIFGDYDADGIPGSALLYDFLTKIGFGVKVYIPEREQGYGLNLTGIDALKKEGVTLLITVDLGVRNPQEIDYAVKNGLEVIVLDHHEMGDYLPSCLILNPKQKNDSYPFRELAATGVVFKFIQGINLTLKKVNNNYLKWALDLVAISTICDVVPLVSENRIFAKFGLIVLKKTFRLGLRELYRQAGIIPENIDTYTVGFQIGPRLNAPGRMNQGSESFYLLIEKDRRLASALAEKLDKINRQRQNELKRVLEQARQKVYKKNLNQKKIILVDGENWPHGIIGLVAGKLMEEFARPVIVCERKGGQLRGSARSIDAYNMIEALDKSKKYLLKFGGHKKAAGLSLELEHLSNLYDKLLEIAEFKLKDEDLVPKITIEAKLTIEDLKLGLLDQMKKFEPFGLGNPRPVFLLEKAAVANIRTVGKKGEHLKFNVGLSCGAIGFDLGKFAADLKEGDAADIVFTLSEDQWDGHRKLQLKILDLKIH